MTILRKKKKWRWKASVYRHYVGIEEFRSNKLFNTKVEAVYNWHSYGRKMIEERYGGVIRSMEYEEVGT